jgi:hypothetical protein
LAIRANGISNHKKAVTPEQSSEEFFFKNLCLFFADELLLFSGYVRAERV